MKIRNGPAAVIGYEGCFMPLGNTGKAQLVGYAESQKTCLDNAVEIFKVKLGCAYIGRVKKRISSFFRMIEKMRFFFA